MKPRRKSNWLSYHIYIYMEILLTVVSLVASPKCGKKLILREDIFST